MLATVLFSILFLCLILTVPIAVSLMIATMAVISIFFGDTPMINLLSQSMVTALDSFPLMAVPFFILVGTLMEKTGIARRLVRISEGIAGSTPGGLGAACVVAACIFAAISGSGAAVVAAIGGIMIPTMAERGYPREYSGSLIGAAATIGPVIPPSIPMIMYASIAGVSVIKLFTAGLFPGLLMGVGLIIANYFISRRNGYVGTPRQGGFRWIIKLIWEGKWALLMPVVVLGGIYGGIFTPTESAVIGVFYSIIVGVFLHREITARKLWESLVEAAVISSTIMILMGGATTFGRLLTIAKVPELLATWVNGVTDSPFVVLLIVNAILIVAGCFLDTISCIILLGPLLIPMVQKAGYDLVFFGVLLTVNLCIGFLTPPLGMNLFVAQNVAQVSFEKIVVNTMPFLLVLIATLFIMMLFPQIILFLPRVLGM